ncbi:MAG TPA: hypothetical protein PLI95_18025 [Polyangiaceae bacterium]|nr:hypothetical protein [Polyangiaceae bacterium]
MTLARFVLAAALSAGVISCKSAEEPQQSPPPPPNGTRKVRVTFDHEGNPMIAGSSGAVVPRAHGHRGGAGASPPESRGTLSCDAPGEWKRTAPASTMRLAQYVVPRAKGDAEDGELAVFYFGERGAGDPDETFGRWAGAFDEAARAGAKRSTRKAAGMDAWMIEVVGTFDAARAMAQMGGADGGPSKEMALLGAILAASDGPYYFKLSGPKATVAAARGGFDRMLESCKTGGVQPATSSSAPAASPSAP